MTETISNIIPIVYGENYSVYELDPTDVHNWQDLSKYPYKKFLGKYFLGNQLIATKIRNNVIKDMLEPVLTFPVISKDVLTLEQIKNNIPKECLNNYNNLYISVQEKIFIGDYVVMKCIVLVKKHDTERYFFNEINNLSKEEMRHRYNKCIPFNQCFPFNELHTVKKDDFGSIDKKPYLFYAEPMDKIQTNGDTMIVNNTSYELALTIPTIHYFNCASFFKPYLSDVLTALPENVCQNNFLVTTDYSGEIIGSYHIGITKVYTINEKNEKNEKNENIKRKIKDDNFEPNKKRC